MNKVLNSLSVLDSFARKNKRERAILLVKRLDPESLTDYDEIGVYEYDFFSPNSKAYLCVWGKGITTPDGTPLIEV